MEMESLVQILITRAAEVKEGEEEWRAKDRSKEGWGR